MLGQYVKNIWMLKISDFLKENKKLFYKYLTHMKLNGNSIVLWLILQIFKLFIMKIFTKINLPNVILICHQGKETSLSMTFS